MDLIKGYKLRTGDAIGIIATGSPVNPDSFASGIKELHRRGYKTIVPIDPCKNYDRCTLFSGTKTERLEALHSLLSDEEVRVIFSARGGYGTQGLLPEVNYDLFYNGEKTLVGFSDVTALLLAVANRTGLVVIYGPSVAVEFANYEKSFEARSSVDVLMNMLENPNDSFSYQGRILKKGNAKGRLLAGNLTLLQSLLATPWDMSYEGKILIIEEINEAPYRIHRMLTQLAQSGKFDGLAGLAFGNISGLKVEHGPNYQDIIDASVGEFCGDFPVLCDLPIGHLGINYPIPIGCLGRIEGDRLLIEESPILSTAK